MLIKDWEIQWELTGPWASVLEPSWFLCFSQLTHKWLLLFAPGDNWEWQFCGKSSKKLSNLLQAGDDDFCMWVQESAVSIAQFLVLFVPTGQVTVMIPGLGGFWFFLLCTKKATNWASEITSVCVKPWQELGACFCIPKYILRGKKRKTNYYCNAWVEKHFLPYLGISCVFLCLQSRIPGFD